MTRRKSLLLAFAAVAAAVSAVYASAYAWLAGEDDRADRRQWDALADQARLDLTAARLWTGAIAAMRTIHAEAHGGRPAAGA